MKAFAATLFFGAALANMDYNNNYDKSKYGNNYNYGGGYGDSGLTTTIVVVETKTAEVQKEHTMMDTTTTVAAVYTPPPMMHETTAAVYESPPPMMHDTTTAAVYVSAAPQAGAMTHTVTVGGDAGLKYTPESISAAVGDIVHFVFMKQNHSVTQSTFDKPCNRLLDGGVDSGLLPNPNNTVTPPPTFEYTVLDTKPTWWYCKQRTGTHCGKGMVFAINPTMEKSLDKFKMKAIEINGTAATTTGVYVPPAATGSTVTLIAGGTTTTAAGGAMQTGWNQGGSTQCSCACFCGIGSYSPGQGMNGYGGYPGSLPKPW